MEEEKLMVRDNRCPNLNHRRTNVTVRFCSMCGEIVNGSIPTGRCSEEEHATKRRQQEKYCVDCGEQLIEGI